VNAPLRELPSDSNGAIDWRPGRLWSLWDIMKAFNAGRLSSLYAKLMQLSERASVENSDNIAPNDWVEKAKDFLTDAQLFAVVLNLTETHACIKRTKSDFDVKKGDFDVDYTVKYKELNFGILNCMRLMQSELEKRRVFAIDQEMTKYFREARHGDRPPALQGFIEEPPPLFGESVQKAFPSAQMDIIEAGRCLALTQNNAAVYHLMQVSEIGLRVLARDRRVVITKGKNKKILPLEFAQWGEIIGELDKKKELINQWKRAKTIREEAIQYYSTALFEVSSFNDIFRKHISHARGKLYDLETAISCWGHVYRFMDKLAERFSEGEIAPQVWKVMKK